jgi:hypothetical protein
VRLKSVSCYRRRIATRTGTRHMVNSAWLLPCVLLVALATSCADGDDDGPLTDAGGLTRLTDAAVGTCLDFGDSVDSEVAELPTVPCSEPHTHEIYALADSDAATYPGLRALEAEAETMCLGEFEDYVGVSAPDSELFYSWLVPTRDSWDRGDDRQIVCILGGNDGNALIGTVRDLGR